MLRASLRFLWQRAETMLAVVNTAAGSAYWLALAFTMTAAAYGQLMALQAAVLLFGIVLSFRTHDLVFYARSELGYAFARSVRVAMAIEWLTTLVAIPVATIGAILYLSAIGQSVPLLGLAGFAVLSCVGTNHGAAIAQLRYAGHGDLIFRADALCVATWLAVLCVIPFADRLELAVLLLLGALPMAVRAVWLTVHAIMTTRGADLPPRIAPSPGERAAIVRFLLNGQLVNVFKNGAVSLETLVLAAFASDRVVGLYRIVRGALGVSVAALNVMYQKAFPKLSRAATAEEKRSIVSHLDRNSALVQLAMLPLAAVVILVYAFMRKDVDASAISLLLVGIAASQLPAALQQGSFAVLSLAGRHHAASIGFVLSAAVLAVTGAVMVFQPTLVVFLCGLTLANLLRLGWIKYHAARAIDLGTPSIAESGPADRSEALPR
jgi:hypothetical protein